MLWIQGEIFVKGVKRTGLLSDMGTGESLRLGMVFQSGALFDSLTVEENVGFLLYEHSSLKKPEIQIQVRECLSKVGLKVRHLHRAVSDADLDRASNLCIHLSCPAA